LDSGSDQDLPPLIASDDNRARLGARLAEASARNRSDIALDIAHLRTAIAELDDQPALGAQEYTRLVDHLLGPGRSRTREQRNPTHWICGLPSTMLGADMTAASNGAFFTIDVSAAYNTASEPPPSI